MRHKKDFQYTPGKDGKGTLKYTFTIKTSSLAETIHTLAAAGYPGLNTALDFKQTIQREIPLMRQIE
jgi:hypothetical protein